MPTLNECAVSEFLKDRRSDAGVNEKKFQRWDEKNSGNDLRVIRLMLIAKVKLYNNKLEDLKAEISETEVFV